MDASRFGADFFRVSRFVLALLVLFIASPRSVQSDSKLQREVRQKDPNDCVMCNEHVSTRSVSTRDDADYSDEPVPPHCGRSRYHEEHESAFGNESEGEDMEKRIVGGVVSQAGEWPWLVSMNLDLRGSENFDHVCGASLISEQWILTAAHCFGGSSKPSMWRMRLGEHNLFEEDETQISVPVERIFVHPLRAGENTLDADVALVKLSRPIETTEYINTVCLPGPSDAFNHGDMCLVAGWGNLQEGGNGAAKQANHVAVPIIDRQQCKKMYQRAPWGSSMDQVTSTSICAGPVEGGQDSCQGDSGGPLVCYDSVEGRWLLAGVVSYGFGCARAGFPGIYAKVSKFMPWIEETIARHS